MYVDVHCKHVCFNQNEVFVLISNVNWIKKVMMIILVYVDKPFVVSKYYKDYIMNNCLRQGLLLFSFWSPFLTDAILYLIFVGYHFQSYGNFVFCLVSSRHFRSLQKLTAQRSVYINCLNDWQIVELHTNTSDKR